MSFYILHSSFSSAALLLSMMGLWFTIVIPGIDRWSKRFFVLYFTIFMLCCLSGIAELAFQAIIVPSAVFRTLLFFESLLLSLPLPMLTFYMLHCCGEDKRSSKLFHTVLVLWVAFFVLNVLAMFIEGFYYITPENRYYRGPLYSLIPIPMLAILLLNFVGTMRRRARLSRKTFLSFLVAILPMTITLFVQMFVDIYRLIYICTALSSLSMHSLILSDQIEQDRRQQRKIVLQEREIALQQREIAHERASVMVLQMRPHFVYNTLTSIHCLCKLNPQKAQQITMDFSNYLHRNFNAIASDSAILFSRELEHTRAYLAVEQALHDDMLVVDWNTAFTNFRLPPLTLQPIVENAVKHGMDPDAEPLYISIRTRHTDSGTEVIVEDTGPGFDPSDESKPHTTLNNIRQRLEMMCGGSMAIQPRDGGGTVVTVTIPDSVANT